MRRHWWAVLLVWLGLGLAFIGASRWRTAAETFAPEPQGKPEYPAGKLLMDATTRQPAAGAMAMDFVRGPGSTGRYLIAVNSGFGLNFNSAGKNLQSLAVIDLQAAPEPQVIQNIYFPQPQSVNVGVAFGPQPDKDGAYPLYVSGGVENKIWLFRFTYGARQPISPASARDPNTPLKAPSLDVSSWAIQKPDPRYHDNLPPVYPTGLAHGSDGDTLFVANNLSDNLGIINNLRGTPKLSSVPLPGRNAGRASYPYAAAALRAHQPRVIRDPENYSHTAKAYVSLWNDESVAVVTGFPNTPQVASYIPVGRHPTALLFNAYQTRLYVANSNDDSVSVVDTDSDQEIERINVRLAESQHIGGSPEGLALSDDGAKLYVANAHSGTVAVVALGEPAQGKRDKVSGKSQVLGFIPTGLYPSAVAVAGKHLFIANGKGTGWENSSVVANNTGQAPNAPNDRFPTGWGRGAGGGGAYSLGLVAGTISLLNLPTERELAAFTQTSMRKNGLLGAKKTRLFPGASPIKHIIYIIRENRTYDQVFGDLERAGNGQKADGDPGLAIFGAGDAAQRPDRDTRLPKQNITPNARALALRFGLLDRFFVNSEASPDGHNWSTAAFSSDYVDKAHRWDYSGRGRGYDYEGFNRLPNVFPQRDTPPLFDKPATGDDVINFWRRFAPDVNGGRDVAEPETRYLWDACAKAGLSYHNYGEFVATLSQAELDSINRNKSRTYPDLTPTVSALPTKKTLESHHSPTFRNFDQNTPDAMTPDSYRAAKTSRTDPLVSPAHADARARGYSRTSDWLAEFNGYVADLQAGRGDKLPAFSMVRLPNDHTQGTAANFPTPQFYVAENDYALGRLVQAVSRSPYWKNTAIFVLEDDAQDGPDHVDAHRSPAFVISAYNRPGALIHDYHNTVSLIRTMELLLGLPPMNFLDANAAPIDIFHPTPDLRPFDAILPEISPDNLMTPPARTAQARYWQQRTLEQDLEHADMADAATLNQAIWFSVRGPREPMPRPVQLPVFTAMRAGMKEEIEEADEDDD